MPPTQNMARHPQCGSTKRAATAASRYPIEYPLCTTPESTPRHRLGALSISSDAVIVKMIVEGATRNCAASVSTRNTSTKKSKASSVHPRKLAVTACHWSERDKEVASSVEPVEFIAVARSSWLVARGPSYIP